jgi:hypothetical protein
LAAFAQRTDLEKYGDNALLLFALQLRFGATDIDGIAATALTDSPNDKACDLVYVDREAGRVVVAQGYHAATPKKEAPAGKASALNGATSWLLSGDASTLPTALRSAAEEVRDAIGGGDVHELELWYCHNLPESSNVQRELEAAATTADSLIHRYFEGVEVAVRALEVGVSELERMYERTEASIAVVDDFTLEVSGGFEEKGDAWSAYTTSVSGAWLLDRWKSHGGDLMSPNVREYLGIVQSERNINNGIKQTVAETPERFWIYNNGITVLVHSYTVTEVEDKVQLELSGLGIVNGAQTTGTISSLDESSGDALAQSKVMTRFVKCDDPEVLADIVKYNNTQNKIEAADFRSKDATQDRLRTEFTGIPDAEYRGARRGGIQDAIKRSPNRLPDAAVAKALAAFQLEPNLAYNETRRIWEQNETYSRFFNDALHARHVVFCFSLQREIEETKKRLTDLSDDKRTEAQEAQLDFFRRRGSISLMVSCISASIETFLGKPVKDRMALRFKDNCSPSDGAKRWQPIVIASLSFAPHLVEATDLGLKNRETVAKSLDTFRGLISATAEANKDQYKSFAKHVEETAD